MAPTPTPLPSAEIPFHWRRPLHVLPVPTALASLLLVFLGTLSVPAFVLPPAGDPPLTFERDIRPILKAHCFDCHGEGDRPRGELDLRLRRFMLAGGDSGPALVPGQPDASPLFELVRSGRMPKRDAKLTPPELDLLRRWIEQGAPTARPEPDSLAEGMQITPEEREHWAFQPPRRPPVPDTADPSLDHPIDAFLAARAAPLGVTLSEPAPHGILVRRAFLNLWGLPPGPSDRAALDLDPSPDAYARLLDRLLDSPRYGERWARHWLDIAGYADSDGYTNDDTPRPYAWKYRDYVIRSFNDDLPFDRFLLEQFAGDELALAHHPDLSTAARDPATRDWLVATAFLRMAADGTGSGAVDQDTARNQVLADTLKIVSTSLLGLSVGCAQCHDHRYDPIPQLDYYRLRAVFEPAYDWKNWRRPSERLVSLHTPEERALAAAVEQEAAALSDERSSKQAAFLDDALRKHLEKFEPPLRDDLWTAFKTSADQRTPEQRQLLAAHPSVHIHPGVLYQYDPQAAEQLKALDARIAEVRARRPPEDFISVLTEPAGDPPVTHLFHRGDPRQPRQPVAPGTLAVLLPEGASPDLVLPVGGASTSGRRLALARWLTRPDHPLVPRVLVNRVWMHHFGRGLVETPADFGLQGAPPSHPELLDWLASVFVAPVSDDPANPGLGWSLKRLHRLIMTSRAWRQSSARRPDMEAIDPENRLLWRQSVRRLDAEAIRDGFLAVSGACHDHPFGPPVPVREDAVGQIVVGIDRKQGDNKMPVDVPMGAEEFRRSIYLEVRRSRPLAFLTAFDAPVMEVNCELRPVSTVAPQSLMLLNSDFALQQARLFAERLAREAGPLPEARVERAFQLAYARPPSPTEFRAALDFLERHVATLAAQPPPDAPPAPHPDPAAAVPPLQRALESLCQVLLGSNEFLYLD